MITLLVNIIFTFPNAQRVTADIDKDNKDSEKTLLACGFTLLDDKRSRYVIHKRHMEKLIWFPARPHVIYS